MTKFLISDFHRFGEHTFHEVGKRDFDACLCEHDYYVEKTSHQGQRQRDYYDKKTDFLFAYEYVE